VIVIHNHTKISQIPNDNEDRDYSYHFSIFKKTTSIFMNHFSFTILFFLCFNFAQSQKKEQLYDLVQYAPSLGYLSSSYFEQTSNFKKDLTLYGISFFSMATSVKSLKYFTHIERPDGSDFNSFPSGHAAVSFMGAELMRLKHKRRAEFWIPSYVLASIVSIQRIEEQHHRPLEVISGALIGIGSAHLGKLIYSKIKRSKISKKLTN